MQHPPSNRHFLSLNSCRPRSDPTCDSQSRKCLCLLILLLSELALDRSLAPQSFQAGPARSVRETTKGLQPFHFLAIVAVVDMDQPDKTIMARTRCHHVHLAVYWFVG